MKFKIPINRNTWNNIESNIQMLGKKICSMFVLGVFLASGKIVTQNNLGSKSSVISRQDLPKAQLKQSSTLSSIIDGGDDKKTNQGSSKTTAVKPTTKNVAATVLASASKKQKKEGDSQSQDKQAQKTTVGLTLGKEKVEENPQNLMQLKKIVNDQSLTRKNQPVIEPTSKQNQTKVKNRSDKPNQALDQPSIKIQKQTTQKLKKQTDIQEKKKQKEPQNVIKKIVEIPKGQEDGDSKKDSDADKSGVNKLIRTKVEKDGDSDKSGVNKLIRTKVEKDGDADKSGVNKLIRTKVEKDGDSDKSGLMKLTHTKVEKDGDSKKDGDADKSGVDKLIRTKVEKDGDADKSGVDKLIRTKVEKDGDSDKSGVNKLIRTKVEKDGDSDKQTLNQHTHLSDTLRVSSSSTIPLVLNENSVDSSSLHTSSLSSQPKIPLKPIPRFSYVQHPYLRSQFKQPSFQTLQLKKEKQSQQQSSSTNHKHVYNIGFQQYSVSDLQVFKHPVQGFYAPIQINPGSSSPGRLNSQHAILNQNSISSIERSLQLKKGDYKISFEWQTDQMNGELQIFFNHQLVGSFKSQDTNSHKETAHLKTCDCCQGKNLIKFVVTGPVSVGLDNIHVYN